MERNIFKMLSLAVCLILAGCEANPASQGNGAPKEHIANTSTNIYNQQGMEISKIVSQMADTLYNTMRNDLIKESESNVQYDKDGNVIRTSSVMPKVAVTSFVDTDTYENAVE